MGKSRRDAPSQLAMLSGNRPRNEMCPGRTQAGKPCGFVRGFKTDHVGYGYCQRHGGNTQAGKTHAAREMGRGIAAEQKKRFGGMKITNVVAEQMLLEEVARSAAMVRFIEDKISEWPTEFATSTGLPRLVDEHWHERGVALSETERRAWLYEYRQERKHLVEVSRAAIQCKLAERVVNIAQREGYLFAQMMRAALAEADLTATQARKVTAALPAILRQAASGELVIGAVVVPDEA